MEELEGQLAVYFKYKCVPSKMKLKEYKLRDVIK